MFDILLQGMQEQLGIEPTMMRIQPPAGRGDELKRMGRFQLLFVPIFHGKKPVFVRQSLVSWAALCKTGLWGIGLDKATCFGSGSLIGFLRFSQPTLGRRDVYGIRWGHWGKFPKFDHTTTMNHGNGRVV